jgi:transmembrane sensor
MHERVEDEAARWAVRHPLDAAGRAELDLWLARDRRHAGALLRAQAALSAIGHAMVPATYAEPVAIKRSSRRRLLAATGAALAASVAGVIGWPLMVGERVATAPGEIRRLPLADGSVATINSDSRLRVILASESRRVSLDHGQAWFQVAKDRTRPFVVDAGIAQARAVGTAFSVRRGDDGVQIAVTEGTVAVWASDASGAMTILQAGQYADFRRGTAAPMVGTAPAQIERALAWRNGEIALENETLANAVAQFNRYNRQQLVIVDPGLGKERLVGLFKIDRPGDFAATLPHSLDVEVEIRGAEIRISRKISGHQ